jgi:hypothetical protein
MGIPRWLIENWFTALNAVGVVGGLLFTGYSLHSETETRRIANLLTLTRNHRDIWTEFYRNPNLERVLRDNVNIVKHPITRAEEFFVNLVVQHLNSAFYAMRYRLEIKPEGLRQDVGSFFTLPIPQAVWMKLKVMQDDAFVKFVEACRQSR